MSTDKNGSRPDIKKALLNLLSSTGSEGNQFVTFTIDDERFGINIKQIQEITGNKKITPLPNTPKYIKGVLNLRGNIIPIIDPKIKFDLPKAEYQTSSVIVIFQAKEKTIGMIVDYINDVLTIETDHIQETPELGIKIDTDFISSIGKVGEDIITILNIENICSENEINDISKNNDEER